MKLPFDTKSQEREHPKGRPSIRLNRTIRLSGLLAFLSPEDFLTLVTVSTFADQTGSCHVSARTLAQTLNLTWSDARRRLQTLCGLRWRGRPLVEPEHKQAKKGIRITTYRITEVEGLEIENDTGIGTRRYQEAIPGSPGKIRSSRIEHSSARAILSKVTA